jgi:PAS domain S-box-containing protein
MKENIVENYHDQEDPINPFEDSIESDNGDERFRMMFEHTNAIMTLLDPENGAIIDANPAAAEFYGYTRNELRLMNINQINQLSDNKISEAIISAKTKGSSFIFPHKLSDGSIRTVEVFNSAIKFNGKTILFNIINDITKRIEMENELFESELKYRTLFEEDPNYVMLLALDGTIIDINKITLDTMGISRKDIIGKNCNTLNLVSEDRQILLEDLTDNLSKIDVKPFESTFIDKNGELHWIIIYLTPLKNIKNSIIMAVGIDITERKIVENKIKTSLLDKNILIQEIHHRVKNNMQIISSLLNLQTQYVDDEEAVNVLRESQNRVQSMAIIHEKLYQSNDLTRINFVNYIQSLVLNLFYSYNIKKSQIKPILKLENIHLNMETAVPCGLIISELISNSLKYAFPNGMKGEIRIKLTSNNDSYQLCICDNGIGLPEDTNFDNIKTLGLLLVNSLTNQIDGNIKIQREHGTRYIINFKELKYKKRL